ncbi:hypothetical protein E2I00_016611, partial [Balaenoptera physalus]
AQEATELGHLQHRVSQVISQIQRLGRGVEGTGPFLPAEHGHSRKTQGDLREAGAEARPLCGQVVLSYEDEASESRHAELWSGVPYWWGNQVKPQDLVHHLERMKSCSCPGLWCPLHGDPTSTQSLVCHQAQALLWVQVKKRNSSACLPAVINGDCAIPSTKDAYLDPGVRVGTAPAALCRLVGEALGDPRPPPPGAASSGRQAPARGAVV